MCVHICLCVYMVPYVSLHTQVCMCAHTCMYIHTRVQGWKLEAKLRHCTLFYGYRVSHPGTHQVGYSVYKTGMSLLLQRWDYKHVIVQSCVLHAFWDSSKESELLRTLASPSVLLLDISPLNEATGAEGHTVKGKRRWSEVFYFFFFLLILESREKKILEAKLSCVWIKQKWRKGDIS